MVIDTHLDNIREHDGIVCQVDIIHINGIMDDGNIDGIMGTHIGMNGYITLNNYINIKGEIKVSPFLY